MLAGEKLDRILSRKQCEAGVVLDRPLGQFAATHGDSWSLVSQRNHRVNFRGVPRRTMTSDDSNSTQDERDTEIRRRVGWLDIVEQAS